MKLALLALTVIFAAASPASAQSSTDKVSAQGHVSPPQLAPNPFAGVPPANPVDVKSVDSILAALYDVISGPAGERDWNRFRSLFMPNARLTSPKKLPTAQFTSAPTASKTTSVSAAPLFPEERFLRKTRRQSHPNLRQRRPGFQQLRIPPRPRRCPFRFGINSIQLVNDGSRWWVVNILWDEERPDSSSP